MVRWSARRQSAGVDSIGSLDIESKGPSPRWMVAGALAVARRPSLWTTAIRQLARLAPTGWWRRAPFLPVPDADYLRFRLVTAYGGSGGQPRPEDLITYLHWCRAWPEVTS
jgi:hypothetical protein